MQRQRFTVDFVHTSTIESSAYVSNRWQASPCVILKTTVLPVEQLQWIHQASEGLHKAILQAQRLQGEREKHRQASVACCEEMLTRIWRLDLPESERQVLSNRLIKIRTKVLKSKNLTENDLEKIVPLESTTSVSAEPLYHYSSWLTNWELLVQSVPGLLARGKRKTAERLAMSTQHIASKNSALLPSFCDFAENSPSGQALTRSDRKWLYKRIIHMALKDGMSSESNICIIGSLHSGDGNDRCLSVDVSGEEHRCLVLEKWALRALAKALQVDESLVVPSINWNTCFQILFHHGSPASQVSRLRELASLLDQYQDARDPEQAFALVEQCAAAFESVTGLPAHRRTKRHRFIFNTLRVDRGSLSVGGDLAWQIDRIGRLLGSYLESYAANMVECLTQSDGTLCLEESSVADATEWSLGHLELTENHSSGCAFFYGIDFSIAADSIDAINEGDYSLILGDINLFPGGLGMFSQCRQVRSASMAKRGLSLLAQSLADLTRCRSLGILVDSEAWPTNSRWAIEVHAIQQAYEEATNRPTLVIPFYPEANPHLQLLLGRVRFGEMPVDGLCWFLRDMYFSQASHFECLPRQVSVVNHPFFMYALENKVILDRIVHRMTQLHPELRIQTRRQRRIHIPSFLECYDLFAASADRKLETLLALHKDLVPDLGEDIFIKPILGKTFCPMYVNMTSVPGLRTLFNYLRKCQRRGGDEVILEEMRPNMKEFWLERQGQRFSAELRCFYVRAQEGYARVET